jgi:hypothetical protein
LQEQIAAKGCGSGILSYRGFAPIGKSITADF